MVYYFYFRNMRGQNNFWIVTFLIAVLLPHSLLAIVNIENATENQTTSTNEGNYFFFLERRS